MNRGRLIVIGAGPVGLAAGLGAVRRGWDVTVLEQRMVGDSLRRWGPTRFFSPLAMNVAPAVREVLGGKLPPDDSLLTGPEFVEAVLEPLANHDALRGRVRSGHKVVAVGRRGLTRGELAGHPIRAEKPFRLLAETPEGERTFEAERLLDGSGTYGQPLAAGSGGLPVPGERELGERVIRDLGTLEERLGRLAGKRVLLTGHGHSAANAIARLSTAGAEVVWAVRSPNQRPCVAVPNDPLPERARVVEAANELAARPPWWLKMERRASIESFQAEGERVAVRLSGSRCALVDAVAALTGYRPDLSFLSELAIEIAPATEGSLRLARALANITDCLSLPKVGPGDLDSGETGFHLIGAKSYGRARTFLLGSGYAQLETIFDRLGFSE